MSVYCLKCFFMSLTQLKSYYQCLPSYNTDCISTYVVAISFFWQIMFSACRKCALSGMSRLCRHRIKLGDKGSYYYISPSSRARVAITFILQVPTCYIHVARCHFVFHLFRSQQSAIFSHTYGTSSRAWWDTMVSLHRTLFIFVFEYRCYIYLFVSLSSGANVLGGDASSKRDDCGQVRFLLHRPGLDDTPEPWLLWQVTVG